jgi:hypothetical protein
MLDTLFKVLAVWLTAMCLLFLLLALFADI